jgi:signal peptidase I
MSARVWRILERAFAVTGLVLVLYHAGFDLGEIRSESMQPALLVGDCVLSERLSPRWRAVRRWDVIGFHTEDGVRVLKRVVALPGETVSAAKGTISVDGRVLPRPARLPAATYYAYGNLANGRTVKVEKGYYVLGDHSVDSQDSRWEGSILPEGITGRAWLIVWPLHRAGWVR